MKQQDLKDELKDNEELKYILASNRMINQLTRQGEREHWLKQVREARAVQLQNVGIPTTSITKFK